MELSKKTLSETVPISSSDTTIRISTTHPDLIIRTEQSIISESTEGSIKNAIKEQRKVLGEVRKHGIMIPRFYSLPEAPQEGSTEWNMVTVVQKVEGASLDNVIDLPEDQQKEAGLAMEQTYIRLLNYYREQVDKGAPALEDILGTEQWMYGHVKNSSTNHIYLVDIDAFVLQFTEQSASRSLLRFLGTFEGKFKKIFRSGREEYQKLFTLE